ncbi:hypothetical protein PV325_010213 [Microctonus aethiopoides]|nr:hypothetical protein PV325_010213 [Microctonus aethiopoides]
MVSGNSHGKCIPSAEVVSVYQYSIASGSARESLVQLQGDRKQLRDPGTRERLRSGVRERECNYSRPIFRTITNESLGWSNAKSIEDGGERENVTRGFVKAGLS